jgi:outer membrane usher protein
MGNGRIRKALVVVAVASSAPIGVALAQALDFDINATPTLPPGFSVDDPLDPSLATGGAGSVPLYLSVVLNGEDTGVVGEFTLNAQSNRFSLTRDELAVIGLNAPFGIGSTVHLDSLRGVTYRYDDATQSIHITAPMEQIRPRELRSISGPEYIEPQPGYGAVLNYKLTANLGNDLFGDGVKVQGAYADLEARLYTPMGVLTTTGALSAADLSFKDSRFTRYDTAFTWSSPGKLLSFTAGDIVTSSLPWGRSVRLGGMQLRRDFDLRSDVVTNPRLSYTGMAAVPTAVDVYVDNVKAWSGQTDAGPFKLSDLPYVTSGGEAVIVTRDAAGNEQTQRLSFFAGREVLTAGTLDFSLDVGRARGNYAGGTSDYDDDTVGSASLRYGVTDKLTVLGNAEHGLGLTAGSLGVSAIVMDAAEVTLAYGKSRLNETSGSMVYGTFRTKVVGVDVQYSASRRSDDYADLAYVIGVDRLTAAALPEDLDRLRAATATDALTLNFDDLLDVGSFGVSYIRAERAGDKNEILSASYSRSLWDKGPSVRVGGFKDLAQGGYGVSAGFSMTLGKNNYASAGLSRSRTGDVYSSASLSRPVGREVGSAGYRINFSGWHDNPTAEASGSYRTNYGLAELRLRSNDQREVSGTATFEGAIVAAGGAVMAGNYLSDGFAVVKVGVPGVPVQLHGRDVARTGVFGTALVPDLQAYRNNRVSIDPEKLPLGVSVNATGMTVVPARKSGVTVNFGAGDTSAALVTFLAPDGKPVEAGTMVRLSGSKEDFVVGYDGELWLEGLRKQNTITATLSSGKCSASFTYAPSPDGMTTIDGVVCK